MGEFFRRFLGPALMMCGSFLPASFGWEQPWFGWALIAFAGVWTILALLTWPRLREWVPGEHIPVLYAYPVVWLFVCVGIALHSTSSQTETRLSSELAQFKNRAQEMGTFDARERARNRAMFGNCPDEPCYIVNVAGWDIGPPLRAAFTVGGAFTNVRQEEGLAVPTTIGSGCWSEIRVMDHSFRFVVEDWEGPEFSVWFGVVDGLFDLQGVYMETPSSCEIPPDPIVSERDLQLRACSLPLAKLPWPCPETRKPLPFETKRIFNQVEIDGFPVSGIFINTTLGEITQ